MKFWPRPSAVATKAGRLRRASRCTQRLDRAMAFPGARPSGHCCTAELPCLFSTTAFQNLPCQRVCGIRVAILHEATGLLVPSQTGKTWQTSPVLLPTTSFQGETSQDIGFLIHSGFFPCITWERRSRNFQFLNNSKRECLSQVSIC